VLTIFALHSFTTGRIPHYLDRYLYRNPTETIKPVCVSAEYDLLYLTAFISFFLVMPCVLASRVGHSISNEMDDKAGAPSRPKEPVALFRGATILVLVFIVIHSIVMPLLVRFPFSEPLWVEHNFARNVVFLSLIVGIVALPLQLLCGHRLDMAVSKYGDAASSTHPLSPPRRSLLLLLGTPVSSIAFWLISSTFVLIAWIAATWLAGSVYSPGPIAVTLITSVIALGLTLATIVGQRLQIWRSPLRAIILIAVVSFALHLSEPQTFPIDWFETCAIWTD
jgi:hypothetical protein